MGHGSLSDGGVRRGTVRVTALSVLAVLTTTLFAMWRTYQAPRDTIVHGAVQEIPLPSYRTPDGQIDPYGWLQDGRLWTLGDDAFLISSSPYTTFHTVSMGAHAKTAFMYYGALLSPDGQWCVEAASACDIDGGTHTGQPLAWRLDGSQTLPWNRKGVRLFNWWACDGSGVYSITCAGQYWIEFTPVSPGHISHQSVAIAGQPFSFQMGYGPNKVAGEFPDGRLLLYGEAHLLLISISATTGRLLTASPEPIVTWILDPTGRTVIRRTIWTPFATRRAPPGADPITRQWEEMALSPDGKRLAWLCATERRPWFMVWAHKALGIGAAPRPVLTDEILITDLNGRHEHSVAWAMHDLHGNGLEQLRWLPDGRSVSAIHRGKLAIIPVGS